MLTPIPDLATGTLCGPAARNARGAQLPQPERAGLPASQRLRENRAENGEGCAAREPAASKERKTGQAATGLLDKA